MPVRADFRWREEPPRLVLSFQRPGSVSVEVSGMVFPVLAESRVSPSVASALQALGLGTLLGRVFTGSFTVQGIERREVSWLVSRALPVVPSEQRPGVLLGLDFLAGFAEVSLVFDGPRASLQIGN